MCRIEPHQVLREHLELACRASDVGATRAACAGILALPPAWVVRTLPAVAESILRSGGETEWRAILELCRVLDAEMLRDLAARALLHPDPAVARAGREFIRAEAG